MIIAINILNILSFLMCCFNIKKFVHIYQLKDYNFFRYFKFFSKIYCFFMIFTLFFAIFLTILKNFLIILIFACFEIVINFCVFLGLINSKKTPLKLTGKTKRIIFLSVLILIIPSLCPVGASLNFFVLFISPVVANFLNIYDKIKNKIYILKAQKKLKLYKPKIIAITGSNGKTSVKNILHKILSSTFNVQCTPSSYNTPLGISMFINNSLKAETQFLILEYGARHRYDIKKLCKMFGADYGIITNVSAQHMQTFKNIECVYLAKRELSLHLKNKLCVYNLDNIFCLRMFIEKDCCKLGVKQNCNFNFDPNTYLTNFEMSFGSKKIKLATHLLGRHNITNILLAASLALTLGVDEQKLIDAVKNLPFTPHRLELIKSHINILDDSYNCSQSSAREAIEVLKNFDGKKMVVTPGIIEGGKMQYHINFKLGKMLNICDYVIIVGNTNRQAIFDGLNCAGYKKKVLFVKDLEQSKTYFNLLNCNDTLLLLNDLPDDYK